MCCISLNSINAFVSRLIEYRLYSGFIESRRAGTFLKLHNKFRTILNVIFTCTIQTNFTQYLKFINLYHVLFGLVMHTAAL